MKNQAKKPGKMDQGPSSGTRDIGPFAIVAQLRELRAQHSAARAQVRSWFDD